MHTHTHSSRRFDIRARQRPLVPGPARLSLRATRDRREEPQQQQRHQHRQDGTGSAPHLKLYCMAPPPPPPRFAGGVKDQAWPAAGPDAVQPRRSACRDAPAPAMVALGPHGRRPGRPRLPEPGRPPTRTSSGVRTGTGVPARHAPPPPRGTNVRQCMKERERAGTKSARRAAAAPGHRGQARRGISHTASRAFRALVRRPARRRCAARVAASEASARVPPDSPRQRFSVFRAPAMVTRCPRREALTILWQECPTASWAVAKEASHCAYVYVCVRGCGCAGGGWMGGRNARARVPGREAEKSSEAGQGEDGGARVRARSGAGKKGQTQKRI